MNDKKVFNKMFRDFRKAGFVARQNYWCCQSCGWAGIESDYNITDDDSNVVFYHQQDYEAFKDGNLESILYLAWQGDGNKLKEIIESHGFNVTWNGMKHGRIGILPRKTVYKVTYKMDGGTDGGTLDTVYALSERELERIKDEIDYRMYELVEVNAIDKREASA